MEHVRGVETCLADDDAIAEAVAAADVVIGAVLVAGTRSPARGDARHGGGA